MRNKPVTLKSKLLDKVIELRYMGRGLSYDTIRTGTMPIINGWKDASTADRILINSFETTLIKSQNSGLQPETCLNQLMNMLG